AAHHLDGQVFFEVQMGGAIHRGHAALADLFFNAILAAQLHAPLQFADYAQLALVFGTGGKLRGISAMAFVAEFHGAAPDDIANSRGWLHGFVHSSGWTTVCHPGSRSS